MNKPNNADRQVRLNDPQDLPRVAPFFKNLEIIGPASERLKELEKPEFLAEDNDIGEVTIDAESPILMTSQEVRRAYTSNDFNRIKEIEAQSQKDIDPVYDNITNNGDEAWDTVRDPESGEEFSMSWSDNASVWCYAKNSGASRSGDQSHQNLVSIGTYSVSSSVAGIQSYNLTTKVLLTETIVATAMRYAIAQVMKTGINFVTEAITGYIIQGFAKVGVKASVRIVSRAVGALTVSLTFAVVFICIIFLFNFLNRLYTIRLMIYNWSSTDDWEVNGQYMGNAVLPGEEEQLTKDLKFTIPKALSSGDSVAPPGFQDLETLDAICYTATLAWQNDATFLAGCEMAIQVRKVGTTEGFMWAFHCPRFSDNTQAADDGLQDPEQYFNNVKWNSNPLGFEIRSTSDNIPISIALDALSYGTDNAYTINMHIDQEMT
ncbi:hypothetical protein BJP36_15755 [Moorena producens JHB]|uniref:Uncharacterized protein n=1 Tax=Moorena producens (strain JHB) TaxID=1454205 RepID=A0A1D9G0J2_MOOP1|nr:hypothetical protein [Moorena producens]AOY81139.2 hypothetical protein BJP36_15755 [Moorena producens JHB]